MDKNITAERKAMLAEGRQRRSEQRNQRRVSSLAIGPWSIFRLDERNIVATKSTNETDYRYFSDTPTAVLYVLRQEVTDAGARNLDELKAAVEAAQSRICAAIERCGAPA